MSEERITTTEAPSGETHTTHTTVIDDGGSRGGSGWLIGLVLLIAVIAGIWYFSGMSGSETSKNNAIAGAANDVGDAAKQVGNAAEDAANDLKKN